MTSPFSRRLAALAVTLAFVACLLSSVRSGYAWEDAAQPSFALTDAERRALEALIREGAPADWPAIRRAAASEPRILDRTLEASTLNGQSLLTEHGRLRLADEFLVQLKTRSALVGIANGQIGGIAPSGQELARRGALAVWPEDYLVPDIEVWEPVAYAALPDEDAIVAPICASGECGGGGNGVGGGAIDVPASPDCYACISGDPYDEAHFQSVAKILPRGDGSALCTGSVLNSTTILTAAHCVVKGGKVLSAGEIRVIIDGMPDIISVTQVDVPEGFFGNGRIFNTKLDVAILTISGTTFPDGFEFARLSDSRPSGKIEVTIAGYGHNTMAALSDLASARLYVGRQSVDFDAEYSGVYRWVFDPREATAHSSLCQGDSGGPMFLGKTRQRGHDLVVGGVMRQSDHKPTGSVIRVAGDSLATACTSAEAELIDLHAGPVKAALCEFGRPLGSYCS